MPKTRKVVLIRGLQGPSVSTRNMRRLRGIANGKEGTVVEFHTYGQDVDHKVLVTVPGTVDLPASSWVRARVVDGDHESVLCTIED